MIKKETLAKNNIIDFAQLDQENQKQLFSLLSIQNYSPQKIKTQSIFQPFICQQAQIFKDKEQRKEIQKQYPLKFNRQHKQKIKKSKCKPTQNLALQSNNQYKIKNIHKTSYKSQQEKNQQLSLVNVEAKSQRACKQNSEPFIFTQRSTRKPLANQSSNCISSKKNPIKIKQVVHNGRLQQITTKNQLSPRPSMSTDKKLQLIKKTKLCKNIDAHFAYSMKQFNLTLNGVCPHKLPIREVKKIIEEIFEDMASKSHSFSLKNDEIPCKNHFQQNQLAISTQNKIILNFMERKYKKIALVNFNLINLLYSVSFFLLKPEFQQHKSIYIFSRIVRNHYSLEDIIFFILTRQYLSNALNLKFINNSNKNDPPILLKKNEVRQFLRTIIGDHCQLLGKYEDNLFEKNDEIDVYELLVEITEDYKQKSFTQSWRLSHLSSLTAVEDQTKIEKNQDFKQRSVLIETVQINENCRQRSKTVKKLKQDEQNDKKIKYFCKKNSSVERREKIIHQSLMPQKLSSSKHEFLNSSFLQKIQKLQQCMPKDSILSGIILSQKTINAIHQIQVQQWFSDSFWVPKIIDRKYNQFEKQIINKLNEKTRDFMQIILQQTKNIELKNKIQKVVQDKAIDILLFLSQKNEEKLSGIVQISKISSSYQSLLTLFNTLEHKFQSNRKQNQSFLQQNHQAISKLCKKILAVPEITDRLEKILPYL